MRSFLLKIAVMFIAVTLAVLVCVRIAFAEEFAIRIIEQNGAAVSKPIPDVTVFVPHSGGGEKAFADQQFLAISPVLKDIRYFDALQLNGSSVTDASIGQLKKLVPLRSLDVSYTGISANGLLQLRSLPSLRCITTGAAQLSCDDLNRLKAAMPGVTFR